MSATADLRSRLAVDSPNHLFRDHKGSIAINDDFSSLGGLSGRRASLSLGEDRGKGMSRSTSSEIKSHDSGKKAGAQGGRLNDEIHSPGSITKEGSGGFLGAVLSSLPNFSGSLSLAGFSKNSMPVTPSSTSSKVAGVEIAEPISLYRSKSSGCGLQLAPEISKAKSMPVPRAVIAADFANARTTSVCEERVEEKECPYAPIKAKATSSRLDGESNALSRCLFDGHMGNPELSIATRCIF